MWLLKTKACVCSCLITRIAGSNYAVGVDVCILCLCVTGCSLIQRCHTVCVIVYDLEVLTMRQPRPKLGCYTTEEEKGDGLCKNENNFYSFFL